MALPLMARATTAQPPIIKLPIYNLNILSPHVSTAIFLPPSNLRRITCSVEATYTEKIPNPQSG